MSGASIRPIVEAFADRMIERGCRARVVDRLRAERRLGRTLVIATAAHRFYVEAIAARLGVEHVVATESVWIGDALLPRLDGPNRRGQAKLDALEAWMRARPDLSRRGFVAFTDDLSDRPLLEAAARPVVVHPGAKLRRLARARGWEVLS